MFVNIVITVYAREQIKPVQKATCVYKRCMGKNREIQIVYSQSFLRKAVCYRLNPKILLAAQDPDFFTARPGSPKKTTRARSLIFLGFVYCVTIL
jgi:hypothetical protein